LNGSAIINELINQCESLTR